MKTTSALRFLLFIYAVAAPTQNLLALTGQLDVMSAANIYGAGHASAPGPGGGGGGIVPPSVSVTGSDILTFQVTGQVSDNGGGNYYGTDGYVASGTLMNPLGGLSGIQHPARIFLAGVFLNNQEPGGSPPAMIDYSSGALTEYSPLLNQVFFIGDGLTGTGTGSIQSFSAPSGTTRLFFGFTDGSNITGLPGDFIDNIGSLQVNFTITPVPEPSVLALGFVGAASLLIARRLRPLGSDR